MAIRSRQTLISGGAAAAITKIAANDAHVRRSIMARNANPTIAAPNAATKNSERVRKIKPARKPAIAESIIRRRSTVRCRKITQIRQSSVAWVYSYS